MENHGEKLAVGYLRSLGWEILDRNFRCRFGEVDIVARDGDEVVFVEVRERSSGDFGTPEETVDFKKLGKIQRCAELWAGESDWRIDVVGILGGKIEHLKDVCM